MSFESEIASSSVSKERPKKETAALVLGNDAAAGDDWLEHAVGTLIAMLQSYPRVGHHPVGVDAIPIGSTTCPS